MRARCDELMPTLARSKETPAAKPKAKAPKSKKRGSKSGPLIPEKLFKARDKNQDGELSLEEYTVKPVEEAPARTKIFQGLDADGDGKLTLEELKKAEK